jgi:hypothetical protein
MRTPLLRRFPPILAVTLSIGCDHTEQRRTFTPLEAPGSSVSPAPALPTRAAPAPLPTAWNGERLPPRLEYARRFSTTQYERFASRSLYLDGLVQQIAGATYATKLHAVERDLFIDDDFYRDGELVFLRVGESTATAFASRYYVDITYPSDKLHGDGFGRPEWGRSSLRVGAGSSTQTRPLTLLATDAAPTHVEPGTVQYRKLADNDAVLLYFHSGDIRGLRRGGPGSMRMDDPDRELEALVREATHIFGQEFVLLSRAAFKALQDGLPERDIATELLAAASGQLFSMVVGKALIQPLLGSAAGMLAEQAKKQIGRYAGGLFAEAFRDKVDEFERRDLTIRGRRIAARTLQGSAPRTEYRHRPDALPEPRSYTSAVPAGANTLALARGPGPRRAATAVLGAMPYVELEPGEVELLGVDLPPVGTEERVALDEYLRQLLAAAKKIEFVRFAPGGTGQTPRGLVFVPDQRLVLNLELVRHGLARSDVDDDELLTAFPEFATAAKQALREGTGFAARWRADDDYVRVVAQPRRTPVPIRTDIAGAPASSRPDRARCIRFAEHFGRLMTVGVTPQEARTSRSVFLEMREELISECVAKGTERELTCALHARSMEALEQCGGREPRRPPR